MSDWYDNPPLPDLRAEAEYQTYTGLITSDGDRIVRVQPPIGFGRDAEHLMKNRYRSIRLRKGLVNG